MTDNLPTPESLSRHGWIINLASTPTGCCASILSKGKPYRIYRCQNAMTITEAYTQCVQQMEQTP